MSTMHLNACAGSEHPQRRPEEIFIGYANGNGIASSALQSLRRGDVVIDDFGVDVSPEAQPDIFPVFASALEYHRMFGP